MDRNSFSYGRGMKMHWSLLPQNAFIEPSGKNEKEVRKLVSATIDLIINSSASAKKRPPLPNPSTYNFGQFPKDGLSNEELLKEIQYVLDCSMNPLNPKYIGHMDSIPTLISSLGEFISTSLNNNMLSLEMSPLFSHMEVQVIQAITRMFGYDEHAGGVMLSGGSLANLQALAVARNYAFPVLRNGLVGLEGQPVVFASEVCHTSIQKATMLLGIGTSAVIPVKTNKNSQMDVIDLELKIEDALRVGKKPFAIVATAGTTVTGNIDLISTISNVVKRFGLWLHVDGAYGGALIFSKKQRYRLNGIDQADSITFNPQKWMYIAKTCAMVLFKNRDILQKDFRITAPYMNDTEFTNLGEISVQGTRHADIFKLWLSLQHIGLNGYEELLEGSYELLETFMKEVRQRPYLVPQSEPETNICCFRGEPEYLSEEGWDSWNYELQQTLLQEEQTFISLPTYRGNRWLRAVLLNPFTTKENIHSLFRKIDFFYTQKRNI